MVLTCYNLLDPSELARQVPVVEPSSIVRDTTNPYKPVLWPIRRIVDISQNLATKADIVVHDVVQSDTYGPDMRGLLDQVNWLCKFPCEPSVLRSPLQIHTNPSLADKLHCLT
ncbi:hypothetical protein Tco_0943281 [Tanacetum coccineum]